MKINLSRITIKSQPSKVESYSLTAGTGTYIINHLSLLLQFIKPTYKKSTDVYKIAVVYKICSTLRFKRENIILCISH